MIILKRVTEISISPKRVRVARLYGGIKVNVYVLFMDPDNGVLDDVKAYAFSSEMAALKARGELIEDGCESILQIRKLFVSNNWVLDGNGGLERAND